MGEGERDKGIRRERNFAEEEAEEREYPPHSR